MLIAGSIPELLRGILESLIALHRGIEVSQNYHQEDELLNALKIEKPNVIILGQGHELDATFPSRLLRMGCNVKVIALRSPDCDAVLHQLVPQQKSMGRLSVDLLLRVIDSDTAERGKSSHD